MLYYTILYYIIWYYVILCYIMLYYVYVRLCYVMLCYIMLCYIILHYIIWIVEEVSNIDPGYNAEKDSESSERIESEKTSNNTTLRHLQALRLAVSVRGKLLLLLLLLPIVIIISSSRSRIMTKKKKPSRSGLRSIAFAKVSLNISRRAGEYSTPIHIHRHIYIYICIYIYIYIMYTHIHIHIHIHPPAFLKKNPTCFATQILPVAPIELSHVQHAPKSIRWEYTRSP